MSQPPSSPQTLSPPRPEGAEGGTDGRQRRPEQARGDRPGPGRSSERRTPGPGVRLETERGTTTIEEAVVTKIAAIAAREVSGVAELGTAISSAMSNIVGAIRGTQPTGGVSVEVGATQAAVDLTIKVSWPVAIHEVAEAVRQNVIDRIETLTGLEVTEVNIDVIDLLFPEPETTEQSSSRVG